MRRGQASSLLVRTVLRVLFDAFRFSMLGLKSRTQLAAENLFLRKQLACYLERQVKPRCADPATRVALVVLSRLIDWRQALVMVRPATLIRWHRKGFRLFWHRKSRGRPRLPANLRGLIVRMRSENPTWGEERIAAELMLKLGVGVSPRTVRRYLPIDHSPRSRPPSQEWHAFVRNHARAVLACDFFVTVTATFRVLYVFVVLEVGTRRIAHWNVTEHPTAEWTVQQFRAIVTGDALHQFVIHDRDAIYSSDVDPALASVDLRVLKTPVRAPQANSFCERLVGTIRRECLDFLIPLNERHVRRMLREWSRTTIAVALTPALGRAFPSRRRMSSPIGSAIGFPQASGS